MDWQPIETAPKDGTWILLFDRTSGAAISGTWHVDEGSNSPSGYEPAWAWWVSDDDLIIWDGGDAPTHWMPLPEPPK